MLKRIMAQELRLGMFIETVHGEWSGQSFWRSRFLLNNLSDLAAIRAGRVRSIVVNTDLGTSLVSASSTDKKIRGQVPSTAQQAQALQTIQQSQPAIKKMFQDVRMGNNIEMHAAIDVVAQITTSMTNNSNALIALTRLKSRDEYSFLHSVAVAGLMVHLARSINIDPEITQALGMGGLLHDVGKVKIPLHILNKAGPLDETELKLVRRHPTDAHEQLSRQGGVPEIVLDICLHHHERLDGKGYPKGLSGDQLTLPVRIAAICDVYDALTSRRAYKKAWSTAEASKFMLEQEGQLDRSLLRQFFHSLHVV